MPHSARYFSEWIHLYWVIYASVKAALEWILPLPPPPQPGPLGGRKGGHKFSQMASLAFCPPGPGAWDGELGCSIHREEGTFQCLL